MYLNLGRMTTVKILILTFNLIYFMQGIRINQRPTSSARVVPQSHTQHGEFIQCVEHVS